MIPSLSILLRSESKVIVLFLVLAIYLGKFNCGTASVRS